MGCNKCKQKTKKTDLNPDMNSNDESKKIEGPNRLVGTCLFILSVALIPILIPIMIVFLFNHLIIKRELNLNSFIVKFKRKKKEPVNYKLGKINEENLVLVGVDDVKEKSE